MDLNLRDKRYVVTGGTSGLGRATARALVAEGAKVIVSGRHQKGVDALAAELGDQMVGVVADNADPATPDLLQLAWEQWGGVDGALLSVGGPPAGAAMEVTEHDWRLGFESVFLGTLRIAQHIAGHLPAGGSLVFVLSTSVKSPISGLAVSNGLRPGLAMAAKTLADELGPRGIRVNSLMPGRFATPRVAELDAREPNPAAARAAHEASIPLRRYGDPEEFGKVAAFVLSPAASYLTGASLAVDGGSLRSL
jgi:3-oxoacyl-[acyl-carrier protein] reductase